MNKLGIWAIAIAFAFTLGTVFSADIATAVKPVTEVFVTNTDPIPVTGIVSSPQAPGLWVDGKMRLNNCDELNPNSLGFKWLGEPTAISGPIQGTITQVDVTETDFVAKGFYDRVQAGCIVDSREFPNLFTITGTCGIGANVDVTTEGGATTIPGTFEGNVACIP